MESEEDDEDQEARNKELQRINEELQKADDRCLPSFCHTSERRLNWILS